MNQSYRIVFDSKRMKNTRDQQVLSELKKQLSLNRKVKSLLFVDKKTHSNKVEVAAIIVPTKPKHGGNCVPTASVSCCKAPER
ncbi:hypothetical protein [Adlercreutzia muris]|jgi:hypothetical protein|uniref:Uncharacterized protein n=1 Tax=Adlercreutzia muris TaxID=1796610 RepID=A0A7C8FTP6_9ACTN|nr:hypothetical protein [Adlercreutzia muris]MCI8306292.1 hypothetical protein [Enterorhabdus sp.]KAB1650979.1 hypothetical protein F8D48_03505 [Adlercreutzia muris]MCI9673154.1 hypothetical protein [Enterorhabdus sp.]MCR2028901.1 hypothetical protein [Adlercreutzia muris]MCU7584441.1 hypothetical protein [Adlercreutzia muris]